MTFAAINTNIPILFIADQETNAVYLFNANNLTGPPVGKITDGINTPTALLVDSKGLLYVSNASLVTVYKPGALQPFRTISAAKGMPYSMAAGTDGTLVISYEPAAFLFTPATLVIFDRGSPSPTRKITIPLKGEDLVGLEGVAIDKSDNVFLSVKRYPDGSEMVMFPPGSTQSVGVNIPGGLGQGFDAHGNFYVCYGNLIDEYAPGSNHLIRQISKGLSEATLITVTSDGHIFAPNAEQFNYGTSQDISGNVVEYAPNGASPIAIVQSANDVDPRGVALRPALP